MRQLGRIACRAGAAAAALAAVSASVPAAAAAPGPPHRAVAVCGPGGLEISVGGAGGYTCVATPYPAGARAAGRALIAYVNSAYPAGSSRRIFRITSAASQVVAGQNYQLVLRVYGQRAETVVGTVFRSLSGSLSITSAYVLAG